MRFSIDSFQLLELSETHKKVIQNDIPSEIFEMDMMRRFHYPIWHSNRKHIRERKESWKKELAAKGRQTIPLDEMKLAELYLEDKIPQHEKSIEQNLKCDDKQFFKINRYHKELWRLDRGLSKDPDADIQMCQEMCSILQEKYERCLERLKKEWEPKLLARGIIEIPIDDDAFAELVFNQTDYKNRSQRELEEENGNIQIEHAIEHARKLNENIGLT